jgi:predicted metal-dependent phosphoesterase TrpH
MKKIMYDRPNIKKLKKEGYQLVDMHMHTNASYDCSSKLRSVIKKAKELGIGTAITDHNVIDSAVKAVDNKEGVFVIPGIEVNTRQGHHVLFYFYNSKELTRFYNNEIKNKPLNKTVEELASLKKTYKCVVGLAHPAGAAPWHIYSIKFDVTNLDFFETINKGCHRIQVEHAARWAKKHGKGITACSDAHTINQIGSGLTCAKAKTPKEFLDAIKSKKTLVVGTTLSKKKILRKLPKTVFRLSIACVEKICHISGLKNLVAGKK